MLRSYDDIQIIDEACEGRESIEKARKNSPDVVLMDIGLPGMDGLEAVRRIRKNCSAVKVLALLQYEDKAYVSSVIKAGVAGCISMRASGSELVSAIRAVHNGQIFLCPCATRMLIENYMHSVDADPYDMLTPREKETLKLIAEGYRGRNIAQILGVNLKTVYGHRAHMRKKLGLRNITQLIKYAVSKGLLTTEERVPHANV